MVAARADALREQSSGLSWKDTRALLRNVIIVRFPYTCWGLNERKREGERERKKERERQRERREERAEIYAMLMNGGKLGGNWSAHCISTWTWITICFVVCCIQPLPHPILYSQRERKTPEWERERGSKADRKC